MELTSYPEFHLTGQLWAADPAEPVERRGEARCVRLRNKIEAFASALSILLQDSYLESSRNHVDEIV